MNNTIRHLQPELLWNKFADINQIPRASKKEDRIIAFMMRFGEQLRLETIKDEIGNVIIKKPATKGMENRTTIVMQSHLDMVHQKNNDTDFDFATQGIEMYLDGDWVKAKGTTLGADNGIGVATIMAILESTTVPHPPIEALFTVDEETGMTGAMGLKGGLLSGGILLNLDTEEDNEIGVGCAGGIDVTATRAYKEEQVPVGFNGYAILVKGLNGGHSGMQIHEGLGNANKIMNRLLAFGADNFDMCIAEITGGGLRNAIPRESNAVVGVSTTKKEDFVAALMHLGDTIKKEYATTDPNLNISISNCNLPNTVMPTTIQKDIIRAAYAAFNGVYKMSADIPNLVETSNNLAKITAKHGKIEICCLTRSSVESSKIDMVNSLKAVFELAKLKVHLSGDYPGWTPNMKSPILRVMTKIYEDLHGEAPHVAACHAGLECGILGQNYPEMDMVSFGPNIKGAHSPDERVQISSVQKFWNFTLEILKHIP